MLQMASSAHREGGSPELVMDFAQPEHITAGQYYDERAAKLSALIDEEIKVSGSLWFFLH